MPANAIVQARVDARVKAEAAAVLDNIGLTVSDAVRILLTRVAREGALPFDFAIDPETHDQWFRAKVRQALDDPRPVLSADEVEAHFAMRRASALRRAESTEG